MPDFAADAERAEDLREMQAALARCKAILTGILTSAGEARGENPEVTTLAAFVGELADEWRAQNAGCPLLLSDRATRSEEHTSELQSLMRISYAVFCLKKKK